MIMDPLTMVALVLMGVAATLLVLLIVYTWFGPPLPSAPAPRPEARRHGGEYDDTYCPECWRAYRRAYLRRWPEAEPYLPDVLDGCEVLCAKHRLFSQCGLEELVPATDGPNDEYAEEWQTGAWS